MARKRVGLSSLVALAFFFFLWVIPLSEVGGAGPWLLVVLAVLFYSYLTAKRMERIELTCLQCKKTGAMQKTGEVDQASKWTVVQWRCKHCGHETWKEEGDEVFLKPAPPA